MLHQQTGDIQSGTELVDDTMQALGDYYGRLVAWYTKGGFIDEYGRKHTSNYSIQLGLYRNIQ